MALCKTLSIGGEDEWRMSKEGRRAVEGREQQDLPRSGGKEVVTTEDMSNSHCHVIKDNRQLVAGDAIGTCDDEITGDLGEIFALRAGDPIGEGEDRSRLYPESVRG